MFEPKKIVRRDRFGDNMLNLAPGMSIITNNYGQQTFLETQGTINSDLGWTFTNGQKKKVR